MSGKAYTMREMSTIVDYVNTRKAYGEIRGRKLWTDFASSNLTNRTWQSLKETFLKRILPDIHNPYFGLTRSEICSFKQGYDVDSRSNNKLEIQTISDDSNHSHADNVQDNEKPSTSNNVNNKTTGEVISPSTLDARHRASTETIVLENCYETPEDIQRDLESPKSDKGENKETPSKSLRDLITYAEPLTPMMQQVLDDFATDESEANLEIDENTENQKGNNKTNSEVNKKSEDDKGENFNGKVEERLSDIIQTADSVKIPLGQESKTAENTRNSYDLIENGNCNDSKKDDQNVSSNNTNTNKKEKNVDLTTQTATTQNTNNSTDTTIPGNQEALTKNNEKTLTAEIVNTSKDTTEKLPRKRSNSQNSNSNKEKKKMLGLKNKKKSQSETEDKHKSGKVIAKIFEENNTNKELENQVSGDKQKEEENNLAENYENNVAQTNPCLSSVSLYAEQFKITKYTDSDSSNDVIDAVTSVNKEMKRDEKSPEVLKAGAAKVNEVVILKSHSESDDSQEGDNDRENVRETKQENIKRPVVDKTERDRALASVFGFASGAVSSTRKRKLSRRHRSTSFNHNNASDSSEWTSESDSEYVSPPRGRRNRHSRKYLKPKSGRILSLEEEGGLFVMHGKRIYPLVKDGKIVKNYLTFSPGSDHEDDPNYWKKKYEDERKKTEELKKLVEEAKQKKLVREQSPNVPTTSRQSVQRSPPKLIPIPDAAVPLEEPKPVIKAPEKTLKIKFTKNNEELQLEGHWSQIHPVLTDVVQIFNKDSELGKEAEAKEPALKETAHKETTHKETAHKETNGKADDADEILSIRSTPLDEESVRKKVEKMEEEIFKEIEELDKSEREQAAASNTDHESNVNTRKRVGRPRKSSTVTKSADSSSSPSRAKRSRVVKKTEENGPEAAVEAERPRRQPNTPKKFNSEISTVTNATEKKTPKKSPRKSSKPEPESTRQTPDDDSQTRYMFPPEKTQNSRKSLVTNKKNNARSLTNPTSENLSLNSIESTQGYQDSDGSPAKDMMMLKRKRKSSLTIMHKGKHRRYTRRRSSPCVSDDASSESSNLSFKLQRKNMTDSIKSEVYRSESYQMLMPLKKRPRTTLSKIDETSLMNHNADDALKIHVEDFDLKNASASLDNVRTDGNSSNISLPLSPELSIVENISVSKDLMNSLGDISTINESQAINEPSSAAHNKYRMSAVDVTMPLMGQDCEIQETTTPDHDNANKSPAMSESLLVKINSVDITEGQSISDSLHNRLRNLLLESAKKMDLDTLETIHENCDNVAKTNNELEKILPRGRKRCSTPNKRNSKKKSKTPDIEPVVEEERMEFCSYGGRKSCPPTIQIFPAISNNDTNKSDNEVVKKGRKKKDVIKVKILKPKNKQKKVSPVADNTRSHDATTVSVHTDSGINETSSALFFQDTDDSVDLIHNHSETCLQTRECISDSIEFVERNTSIISVNSQEAIEFRDAENIPPEVFCNNAHDGSTVTRAKTIHSQSTCDTVYHSPLNSDLSGYSLLTEDLSDENANEMPAPSRSNKWYLFSEDETTNTNHAPSFGANLMQIFPLTCAVPDLSTITEMSKENDSRKPTLDADGDTRNDLDSQSMF